MKGHDNGEPLLILLGDKIFEYGYQKILQNPYTVIGVKTVENPQGVGIVETDGEFITRLIEKPAPLIPPACGGIKGGSLLLRVCITSEIASCCSTA